MIDIYVCEDSAGQREAIARYIESEIVIREYDMQLRAATGSPEEIIEYIKASDRTGLYFLDIQLQSDMNGLLLAKEIREYDPRGFIVFITAHSEMAFLTFQYKVEALDFILKDDPDLLQSRIGECMENVCARHKKITRGEGKTITVTRGNRKIVLEYADIMFFETSANEHKLIVHTANKSIEFFGKIKDIERETGGAFVRCHRACLVNRANISEIDYENKQIIMKNQMACPISYRMLGRIKKK